MPKYSPIGAVANTIKIKSFANCAIECRACDDFLRPEGPDIPQTADATIAAAFVKTFTVAFAAGAGGSLTGGASQTVDLNGSCSPVATVPDIKQSVREMDEGRGGRAEHRTQLIGGACKK